MIKCTECGDYKFKLLGCCDGFECGCMGRPIECEPCPSCNPDGDKEPSAEAKEDYPWFFLTKSEMIEFNNRRKKYIIEIENKHSHRTENWEWFGEERKGLKVLRNYHDYAADTFLLLEDDNVVVAGYSYVFNDQNTLTVTC